MTESEEPKRFSGKLVLVLLENKTRPSTFDGRSLWALQRPLTYYPGNRTYSITVPAGCVTDLTTVPRWGWALVPPDGPWVKAAIIHDYLYATVGTGKWKGHPASITRPTPYSRLESDRILREAMKNLGIGWFIRNIIYLAVRLGGGSSWEHSKADMSTDNA